MAYSLFGLTWWLHEKSRLERGNGQGLLEGFRPVPVNYVPVNYRTRWWFESTAEQWWLV